MNRKGQMWISDLMISLLLFMAAAFLAFTIMMNSFSTGSGHAKVKADAARISEYVLSEGTPKDWNITNVIRPGLLTGKRLDYDKTYLAMNLTNSSYSAVKPMIQTDYDFLIVFEKKNGTMIPFQDYCGFGRNDIVHKDETPPMTCQSVNLSGIKYDNLARIDRFVVYDSEIVRMVVYVWD
jgi:hypothetical protein